MAISATNILDVLAAHDIQPDENETAEIDLPGIGEIEEGESVYSTSISEVLGRGDEPEGSFGILDTDDPR